MLFYIVAYDIPDDQRRKRISDILEGYGTRVQYSVFECVLSNQQYQEMSRRLKKVFNSDEDSLRFYPLSKHTVNQIVTWGTGLPPTQAPRSIII